jgi:serine O-acetyltransferase
MMFKRIRAHLDHIREVDPAARGYLEVLLLYPSVHAIFLHRVAHWLFVKRAFFLARLISQVGRFFTGIEIHPGATIGHKLFIDHGTGVVIGETTEIGDRVTLYQGVTLGGTGKEIGKRHPTLGDDVIVGAGAKVLGPIVVAAGTKVGAGSVLLKDTRPGSTAVGTPARIIGGLETAQIVNLDDYRQVYNDMAI